MYRDYSELIWLY